MNRLLAVLFLCVVSGCSSLPPAPAAATASPRAGGLAEGVYAEITTPRGVLLCELYFRKIPLTVASFVGLAEGTLGPEPRKPFFDGLTFHRIVPGFVIQGGDPTGTGRGGPGYRFPDEFTSGLRHDGVGILSMANSGPDTNGSQFFITLGEARYLDFVHSIFGRVVQGQEIVPLIQRGDTMSVKIRREGPAAQRYRIDEKSFAELLARTPAALPPHFEDRSGFGSANEHWQAAYIEKRLANLARFTGRQIFVRLLEMFEPESPNQTPEQFAEALRVKLKLPAGAMLACYFAAQNQWVLAGARPGVTLPEIKPPASAGAPTPAFDNMIRQRQNQMYTATGQVVSSLIDQTDPK
jgi:cyclophilin family peptidyl-prolyl cis-trans isomerase